MGVAVGVVGVDAGGIDDDVDRATFQRISHGQGAAEAAKPTVDLGEAEADSGRRHRGVSGIDVPGPRTGQYRRTDLSEHQPTQVDRTGAVDPAAVLITV
jgi:hypothetical protein